MNSRQHFGTFVAVDNHGAEHIIEEYRTVISLDPLSGRGARATGALELITRAGEPVQYLEKGRYQLVRSRQIITSDDPDAP